METILYNGMELEKLNPDKSVSFNPPIKCVGWNKEDVKVEFELSSALSKDIWLHRFIGKTKDDTPVAFMFCARLQEKPEPRLATNRELAKWLAQGNGEWCNCIGDSSRAAIEWWYDQGYSETKANNVFVRKWDDTEWHIPDVDYLGIERTEDKK